MKLSSIIHILSVIILIICLLGIPSPVSAINEPTTDSIFLPIVFNNYSPLPSLISPPNGEKTDTLIPILQFNSGNYPGMSGLCLAIDTTPNPTFCMIGSLEGPNQIESFRIGGNLLPNQIYYWRVGINPGSNEFWKPLYWSAEYSFTTADADGTILPSPSLTTPADGTVVPSIEVTLQWDPVPGAVEYFILVTNITNSFPMGYTTTGTQLTIYNTDDGGLFYKPNCQYKWSVQARNDYAWGDKSAVLNFTSSQ